MSHYVPDFETDDGYSIPASSARPGKSTMSEDEIMELIWHNGQLVMQNQSQRPAQGQKRTKYDVVIPEHITAPAAPPQQQPENQPHLFMQEDEMSSWLHYPIADDDAFSSDLLYTDSNNIQPNNTTTATKPPPPAPARPPVHPLPPPRRPEAAQNFLLFSRLNSNNNNESRFESAAAAAPPPNSVVRETTTVVDSSDTPLVGHGSGGIDSRPDNASPCISMSSGGGGKGVAATAAASAGRDGGTCEMSLTSSPGGGSTSASGSLSAELVSMQKPPPPPFRKRKGGRETDDAECQSEDVEFKSCSAKKLNRGSSSTKRSRAAEVHNLSERRRRDRINEKMRTLQELIPRCNKSDKASMLDEAIEYLKSLQLQVQMMSMGCGMVPMMFPGVQPYMPMGMARMGMGMGMGMGIEMGMSRPIMPYGNVLAGSPMPTAAAAAHMGPRFPMPAYQMQTMLPNDPNRTQATIQSEHMSNLLGTESQNHSRGPNFADHYQQYFTPQQMQMQLQQNQAMAEPSSSQPSSSMGPENQESHQ